MNRQKVIHKNKYLFLSFIGYLLSVIVLGLLDDRAAIVWLVNGLFFGIATWIAIKIGSYSVFLFFFMLFLGHGIGAPVFFLDEERYSMAGSSAVLNFNFTITEFYKAYFTFFVFCSLLLIVCRFVTPRYKTILICLDLKESIRSSLHSLDWFLVISIAGMLTLNYWMFINGVGIHGMPSREMPFKLTGIMVFFRLFVFPLIMISLIPYIKYALFSSSCIAVYALSTSFLGNSKGLLIFNLLPIIGIAVAKKRKILIWAVVAFSGFALSVINITKPFGFQRTGDISEISSFAFRSENIKEVGFVKGASGLLARLSGSQGVVLSSQSTGLAPSSSYERMFNFLTGQPPLQDETKDLFGYYFPAGFSFGISSGIAGHIVQVSNDNLMYLIPCVLFVSLWLVILDWLIKASWRYRNKSLTFVSCLVIFIGVTLWQQGLTHLFEMMTLLTVFVVFASNQIFKNAPSLHAKTPLS